MRSVAVSVLSNELASEMNRMRLWLDAHRLQPLAFRFASSNEAAAAVITVEFGADAEAMEFANAFADQPQSLAG
jgi:hypothetical protein